MQTGYKIEIEPCTLALVKASLYEIRDGTAHLLGSKTLPWALVNAIRAMLGI